MITQRKILIINPNTSASISDLVLVLARDAFGPVASPEMVTARFGASYIASRASAAIAGHATLDAYAAAQQDEQNYRAVVIACFGDPGIEALREISPVPVIGFAEASMRAASRLEGRFAIATIGTTWSEMLTELAQRLNLSDRLAGFISLDESSRQSGVPAGMLQSAAAGLGAQRVIIGGTGLIPVIPAIVQGSAIPILDAHRIALQSALQHAQKETGVRSVTSLSAPEYVGLAPALADLLAGRHR